MIERIVVVPAYNEGGSILDVLAQIERAGYPQILVADDGSTDGSAAILDAWAGEVATRRVIHLPRNQGKSAALQAAWDALRVERDRGTMTDDTIVINVDADGQHDLAYLESLIHRLDSEGADAVIARRDFSYHGWYKRLGNIAMTALGSLFAGRRMHDIESGYRLIRLGPLLHAQEHYRGHRYSECVEFAVVAQRLGYRVDNDFVVHVPVLRTNTRLKDAVSHVIRMALAWYRVVCWRDVPKAQRSWIGVALATAILAVFSGFLGIVFSHTVYLGNDSAQSYGHVWFIAHSLQSGHGIPLHVPYLENGEALTLPYAAIPWIPAALLRLVIGDFAVTLTMVVGVVLLLWGISRWLPRTASPLVMAAVVVNWQLWNSILQFQLPTVWALGLAALAAAEFDRDRPRRGAALAAAALIAHPLMGGVGIALTLLASVEVRREIPWRTAPWLVAAALVASPAIWTFLQIPAIEHVGRWGWTTPAHITLQRTSILWWPWLCSLGIVWVRRFYLPLALVGAVLLARNFAGSNPQNARWVSIPRFPDYIEAGRVAPQAHYRVLTLSDQEDGMVQLMEAGATLAQDFFDESVERRSFSATEEYRCFLARKGADRILVQGEWTRHPLRDTSNEVAYLDRLVAEGHAALTYRGAAGTLEYTLKSAAPEDCLTVGGSRAR
ncbi:MAG: glycosyltransferase [Dehalococcoidia bacterium]|nr:MAG: glycosyltransferase [Dehalococcoidia bacterium]